MVISHEFNGQRINFNSVEYATTHNLVSFAELSYFLTDFEFKKADGTWMPFAYQALIRARQTPVDTLVFTFILDVFTVDTLWVVELIVVAVDSSVPTMVILFPAV